MPKTRMPKQGILMQSFKSNRGMKFQENRLSGSGMVMSGVVAGDDKKVGSFVYSVNLNPLNLGIPKLTQVAGYYQRFWINKLTFRLSTGLPQNELGSVGGFWNTEPNDLVLSELQANRLNSAIQRPGWRSFNVWNGQISWPMPSALCKSTLDGKVTNELFYTDSAGTQDKRLTSAGNFNIIVDNLLGTNAQSSLGNLFLDYDISFYMQQDDVPVQPSVNQGVVHLMMSTGITAVLPFGTAPTQSFNNTGLTPSYVIVGGVSYSHFDGFPINVKTRIFIATTSSGTVVDAASYTVPYQPSFLSGTITITQVAIHSVVNTAATICVGYGVYDVTTSVPNLYFKYSVGQTSYTTNEMYLFYTPQGFASPMIETIEQKLARMEAKIEELSKEEEDFEEKLVEIDSRLLQHDIVATPDEIKHHLGELKIDVNESKERLINKIFEMKEEKLNKLKPVPLVRQKTLSKVMECEPHDEHYHICYCGDTPNLVKHDHDHLLCSEEYCGDNGVLLRD